MNPRARGRVSDCPPEQARTGRAQARAFLDAADLVLLEPATRTETHVAAALAVLAAVAASDAICGLRLGHYSRGQDHDQAVALLQTVDLDDPSLPAKLRRVLSSKDSVHYQPDQGAGDEVHPVPGIGPGVSVRGGVGVRGLVGPAPGVPGHTRSQAAEVKHQA